MLENTNGYQVHKIVTYLWTHHGFDEPSKPCDEDALASLEYVCVDGGLGETHRSTSLRCCLEGRGVMLGEGSLRASGPACAAEIHCAFEYRVASVNG